MQLCANGMLKLLVYILLEELICHFFIIPLISKLKNVSSFEKKATFLTEHVCSE